MFLLFGTCIKLHLKSSISAHMRDNPEEMDHWPLYCQRRSKNNCVQRVSGTKSVEPKMCEDISLFSCVPENPEIHYYSHQTWISTFSSWILYEITVIYPNHHCVCLHMFKSFSCKFKSLIAWVEIMAIVNWNLIVTVGENVTGKVRALE